MSDPSEEGVSERLKARMAAGMGRIRAALMRERGAGAWRITLGERHEAWCKGELMFTFRQKPSLWAILRYGFATMAVMGAFVLQSCLAGWVEASLPPFILFYPAVTVVAMVGGRGPGLLATALTLVVVDFWLMPPSGGFPLASSANRLALVLFALNGGLITIVAELYHRQSRRAAAYAREVAAGIERQQMATAVQEERDRLSALINSITDEIWFVDADKRITLANPAVWKEFGASLHDGKGVEAIAASFEVYRGDGTPRPVEEAPPLRALRGETVNDLEEIVRTPTAGELRHRLVNSAPVQAADGTIIGSVSVVRDITGLKKAEAALRESEERFRGLVEQAVDGIFVADAQGRYIDVNTPGAAMLGYTPEEVCKLTISDVLASEEIARIPEQMSRLAGGGIVRNEWQFRRKDGSTFTGELVGRQLSGGRLQGIVRDTTERKAAEQALRESEERLAGIVGAAMDAIISVDEQQRVVVFNGAAEKMFGLAPVEILGKPLANLIPQRYRKAHQGHIKQFGATGVTARQMGALGEIFGVRANGEEFPIEASISQGTTGGGKLYTVILRDITERKRTTERLRKSEERMQQALRVSRSFTFEWEPATDRVMRSDSCATILNLTGEEVCHDTGQHYFQRIHPADRERFVQMLRSLTPIANAYTSEYRVKRGDGSDVVLEEIAQATFDATGNLDRLVGVSTDITARKEAEAALQASLREKDVLLHEVHHRVKNNLQVISSLVSLQAGSITGPERRVFVSIQDQVRAMALVHEKLYQAGDFSRIDFAEYARKLLQQLWRAHGEVASCAELVLNLQAVTMPLTMAVPCGLILNELAGNAIKHAFRERPTGGQVTVTLAGEPEGWTCLRVADNGVGLPEGLDWRNAQSLGLRLVQMLTRQLDGTVEARSPNGGGVEFDVRFRSRIDHGTTT